MNKIISIITYETIEKNEHGFYDTNDIIYSVCYENGTIKEFSNNNVPDSVLDYIDYAKLYNETYFIPGINLTEQRETIYFNK